MATTYVLSTPIGKVRLAIGDTRINVPDQGIRPDGAHYTDEEITIFIETAANNWQRAVPGVLRACAAEWSSQAQKLEIDEYKEDFTKTAELLLKTASDYEKSLGPLLPPSIDNTVATADLFGYQSGPRFFSTAEIKDAVV